MKLIISANFLIIYTLVNFCYAQSSANPTESSTYVYAFHHEIYSEILQEKRNLKISLPYNYNEASVHHTYPVLLLLEDEFSQMVSGVVKHLSSVERMPETIVVSLLEEPVTPTVFTNNSNFWPGDQLEGENPDLFTQFLKKELFPYLENNYRANDFRLIMGLSYTSIYTFHSFVNEPELFDATIAIAAGDILGMGYSDGERFTDLIIKQLQNPSDRKRFLYVTSSDADGGGKAPEIKENLEELDKELDSNSSDHFRYVSKIFPNEGHYDVALPAFIEALELIFPKDQWFARYRDIIKKPGNAIDNLDEYFENLSSDYGFDILPKADRWNSVNRLSWIGPYLVRQGELSEGISILERWAEYRPTSLAALNELSKAQELNNNLQGALTTSEKAYRLSLQLESEEAEKQQKRVSELLEKLN